MCVVRAMAEELLGRVGRLFYGAGFSKKGIFISSQFQKTKFT